MAMDYALETTNRLEAAIGNGEYQRIRLEGVSFALPECPLSLSLSVTLSVDHQISVHHLHVASNVQILGSRSVCVCGLKGAHLMFLSSCLIYKEEKLVKM